MKINHHPPPNHLHYPLLPNSTIAELLLDGVVEKGGHDVVHATLLPFVVPGTKAVGQLVGQGDDGVIEGPVLAVVEKGDETGVVPVSASSS